MDEREGVELASKLGGQRSSTVSLAREKDSVALSRRYVIGVDVRSEIRSPSSTSHPLVQAIAKVLTVLALPPLAVLVLFLQPCLQCK